MDTFPKECLRGIPNEKEFIESNLPKICLFTKFDNVERNDDYNELSVTWYDNDDALQTILEQRKKDGSIQFNYGVAVITRSNLDNLKRNPHFDGILDYERQKTSTNPYHGNILLKKGATKNIRNMIAAALAMYATTIIPRTINDASKENFIKINEVHVLQ